MLKITVEPGVDEVRLRLEGDLAGTWVPHLEESWREAYADLRGRTLCLDLTGVLRVDIAARYLLALLHERGTRMVATGVEMRDLLDSLPRDWPPAALTARR